MAGTTRPISEAPKDGSTVELEYAGRKVRASWSENTGQWVLREPLVIEHLTDAQVVGFVPPRQARRRKARGEPYVRPIGFSAAMVRAILNGRKSQARRLTAPVWLHVKKQHECGRDCYFWVRETWAIGQHDVNAPLETRAAPDAVVHGASFEGEPAVKWRPSVHMPRHASRITLKITEAKVEPLQSISAEDAERQGVHGPEDLDSVWQHGLTPVEAFAQLWNEAHARDGCAWEDNPDVVTFTFEPIHANIDDLIGVTS